MKATTAHERRLAVARVARLRGTVLVADLAQEFGVSAMTIRTDLDALAGEGALVRIRGGAAALRPPQEPPAPARSREPLADAESLAVAREAAALVEDDDVIAMDGGDLCHHVAGLLGPRRNLTVLAGAVDTAQVLAANPSNTVILAGSLVRADGRGVQLHPAERPLHGLRVRKALLGCGACDSGGEIYDTDPYTAQLKATMAAAAEGVVLLLSGSEPERRAGVPFARLMDVCHVLSGRPLPPELRRRMPAGALVSICGFQVATRALDLLQGRPVPPAVYLTHEFIERHDLDTIGTIMAPPSPSAGRVAAAPPVAPLRTAAPATSSLGSDARGAR